MLSLAGWINLTNAINPQITFWWRGNIDWARNFGLQVYTTNVGWTTIWNVSYTTAGQWTRVQVPLTNYINQTIRLNFYSSGSSTWIDKIAIAEQVKPVTITSALTLQVRPTGMDPHHLFQHLQALRSVARHRFRQREPALELSPTSTQRLLPTLMDSPPRPLLLSHLHR